MAEPTAYALPHINPAAITSYVAGNSAVAVAAAAVTIIVAVIIWRVARAAAHLARQPLSKIRPESVLTFVVAGMATATSSQAMWRFFGDKLGVDNVYMRAVMFSMYEAAMLVCALRARRAVKRSGQAGVEGKAVWALAGLSGSLAATDEQGFGAGLARLAAPLVAAFLWERGLSEERAASGKRRSLNWRISPERILVWLGVVEATGQSTDQVDAQRRLTRVALAAQRVRALDDSDTKGWRLSVAERRLTTATRAAVRYASLATDTGRQETLVAQIATLFHARGLARMEPAAPWGPPPPHGPRMRLVRTGKPAPAIDWDRLDAELDGDAFADTPPVIARWLDDGGKDVPDPNEPIPDVPGPDPERVRAAQVFAGEICDRKVPSIRTIKKQLQIGQDKAKEVRAYLSVLAAK